MRLFFDDDIAVYGFGSAVPDVQLEFCYLGGKSIPINYRRIENIFSIKDKDFINEIIDRYIDIDNYKQFNLFKEDILNRNERLIEIKS